MPESLTSYQVLQSIRPVSGDRLNDDDFTCFDAQHACCGGLACGNFDPARTSDECEQFSGRSFVIIANMFGDRRSRDVKHEAWRQITRAEICDQIAEAVDVDDAAADLIRRDTYRPWKFEPIKHADRRPQFLRQNAFRQIAPPPERKRRGRERCC